MSMKVSVKSTQRLLPKKQTFKIVNTKKSVAAKEHTVQLPSNAKNNQEKVFKLSNKHSSLKEMEAKQKSDELINGMDFIFNPLGSSKEAKKENNKKEEDSYNIAKKSNKKKKRKSIESEDDEDW